MKKKVINLIKNIEPRKTAPRGYYQLPSRQQRKRRVFCLLIPIFIIIIFFSTNIIFPDNTVLGNLGKLSFWEGVAKMMIGKDKILKGELSDRINILILGMGGEQHDGPYLTDTIILASLKPSSDKLGLLSIPRDLYVEIPNYGWQKINAANSLGMTREKDGGLLTSKTVSQTFDIPIHYWVRIDFSLFEEIIDELGGVEVNVENSFTDYQFPGLNSTYKTVSFAAGLQTMDGKTALNFTRSRHGTNGEGSDFARSKRQQKIILAIKEKIQNLKLLSQPAKILKIYQSLKNNVSTNLDLNQIIKLAKLAIGIKNENILNRTIETEPNGPLVAKTTNNGAAILTTRTGNFEELTEIAKELLNEEAEIFTSFGERSISSQTATPTPISLPNPKIIILNGTNVFGLAKQVGDNLVENDFEIIQTGNTPSKNYSNNIIYQINQQTPKSQLEKLLKIINGKVIEKLDSELEGLFDEKDADFLLILGEKQT
jgi:LCP family protein required for cell wall assembly